MNAAGDDEKVPGSELTGHDGTRMAGHGALRKAGKFGEGDGHPILDSLCETAETRAEDEGKSRFARTEFLRQTRSCRGQPIASVSKAKGSNSPIMTVFFTPPSTSQR